eukprot:SAG31_NODE_539_length_14296_cov_14.408819_2_plen_84_part_00
MSSGTRLSRGLAVQQPKFSTQLYILNLGNEVTQTHRSPQTLAFALGADADADWCNFSSHKRRFKTSISGTAWRPGCFHYANKR